VTLAFQDTSADIEPKKKKSISELDIPPRQHKIEINNNM
jgi:hypothetical protein